MSFTTFTLLLSLFLQSESLTIQHTPLSGPFLYHLQNDVIQSKRTHDEPLIALITSHLTSFKGSGECTFLHWQGQKLSVSNIYNNLVAQFSPHFTSVLTFTNESLSESSLPVSYTKFHASCSVAVYLNLDYFSGSLIFPHNWLSYIPGGFANSYHLIFYNVLSPSWMNHGQSRGQVRAGNGNAISQPHQFTLKQLPHHLQRMVHRIFILISKHNTGYRCDLWNCNIFGESCARIEISAAKAALTTKTVNLNGASLIWAAVAFPQINQKALKDYIKYRKDIDMYITPFVEISEYVNATPALNQVPSQNFGVLDKNGKWTGAAGEVVYGRAHVSNGLVTQDRYEALFLSKTIDTDGLTFATGPPPSRAESPFFLIQSVDWRLWLALLATIFLMLIISGQIIKKYFDLARRSRTKIGQSKMPCSGVVMFIISPLLEQPADSKKYRNFIKVSESRWMFGPWLISLVALGTMFKTSLISTLTSPEVNNSPKDFKTLLNSGYQFNFLGANLTAGAVFKDLLTKGNLLVNELDKRIVSKYGTSHGEDCISKTYGTKFACLGIGYQLLEFGIRYLTEDSGKPLYYISRDYLSSSYYSFCISKKLPHLLAAVDKMMYHYAESGSYSLFRQIIVQTAQKYGKLAAKRRKQMNAHSITDSFKKNTSSNRELENTLRSMIVLGMGFGLATLVLVLELLFHYLSDFRFQFRIVRK